MTTARETAHADQVAAASSEATAIMGRLVEPLGGPIRRNVNTPWLVAFITAHNEAVDNGRGAKCRHLGPAQPAYTAAWIPGLAVCERCATTGALTPDNDIDNWICDRCRRYRPGRVAPSALQAERFIMFVGLCTDCRHD